MRNLAFFNVRYKDEEGQQPDVSPLWETGERFEEQPVDYNNYLYTDENADRWNSGNDPVQKDGQPKGVDRLNNKELKTLNKKVFNDEDSIDSFNKQENIIDKVKSALTGG